MLVLVLSCGFGCNGGPISDFPHVGIPTRGPEADNATSSPQTGAGVAGGVVGGPGVGGSGAGVGGLPVGAGTGGGLSGSVPPVAIGGLSGGGVVGGGFIGGPDAGVTPGAIEDAGKDPVDAGGGSDGGVSDSGVSDSGPNDAGDAGLGDGSACQADSSPRVDGGCRGSYCAVARDALGSMASAGACSAAATLSLVCDGQITRKTAQCAQDYALSLSLGNAVRSCLRRDPQLAPVESNCLDCYTEEVLCTLSNCLATCVAGFETACADCRRERCGAKFTRCSGLPGI